MEENRRPRGSGRGRSRMVPVLGVPLGESPVPVPMEVEVEAASSTNGSSPPHAHPPIQNGSTNLGRRAAKIERSPGRSPSPRSKRYRNENGQNSTPPRPLNGHVNGKTNGICDEEMPNGTNGATLKRLSEINGFRMGQTEFVTTRPDGFDKRGTFGKPKRFLTNYFPLQTRKTFIMRLHEVLFNPEIDEIPKRKALLRTKEAEVGPYIFDGAQLFTTRELPPASMDLQVFFEDKPDQVFQVKIRYIRDGGRLESGATQLFNLIIRKAQRGMKLVLLGRHFFDGAERIDIRQHRLEVWPGYITSMRQMETDIMLNVDLTFKVCRTEDVFTYMKEVRRNDPGNYQQACEAGLVGTIVMTAYNQKTYRVDAIDWGTNPEAEFTITRKGVSRQVSFVNYYKEKDYEIRNFKQPMIISRPTKRDIRRGDTGDKLLVPEMCYQTGLNDEMRGNFRLMKDLAQHFHMAPGMRLTRTKRFMDNMMGNNEIRTDMARWGIRFGTDPIEVEGRQIPAEEILFGNERGFNNVIEAADWSMAFRSHKMLSAKALRDWIIVFTTRDTQNIQNLTQTMKRVAGPMGYVINDPEFVRLIDARPGSYGAAIDQAVGRRRGKLDMIMIVLPTNKLELYASVKKKCSIEYGIPSQGFLAKNLNNPKRLISVCTKLVIQMNAKQGGQPWSVKNPLKSAMIVGFDVHHAKGQRSYGAMVATTCANLASYFSTLTEQGSGVEMCSEMGQSFAKCLRAYWKVNSRLPDRIMFYRDGVGEGQLNYVYQSEVKAIKSTIVHAYTAANVDLPKFTMIVVTKRINTRIFEKRGGPGHVDNPLPGTIVDDTITCPEKYDFYLVPQSARQGTVSPVAFNILCDDSGLSADQLQRYTFKLCHLYYNWSGTVAVPAPCQYAHKLAFLTGTALQEAVNDKLCNFLHFL